MQGIGARLGQEAQQVIEVAQQLAAQAQQPLGSAQLLVALLGSDNAALRWLRENQLEPERPAAAALAGAEAEPEEVVSSIWQTAEALAAHEPDGAIGALHLLAALLRYQAQSHAVLALRAQGVDTTRLRNTLISHLSRQPVVAPAVEVAAPAEVAPAWSHSWAQLQQAQQWGSPPPALAPAPSPEEPHPLLEPNPYLPPPPPAWSAPAPPIAPPPVAPPIAPRGAAPRPGLARPPEGGSGSRLLRGPGAASPAARGLVRPSGELRKPAEAPLGQPQAGEGLAEKLKGRFGSRKPQRRKEEPTKPSLEALARELFVEGDPKRPAPATHKGQSVARKAGRAAPEVMAAAAAAAREAEAKRPEPPKPLSKAERRKLEEQYTLSDKKYPTLCKLARNLSLEALEGRFDGLVGRDVEVSQLVDILNKRRSNNPLLVGPPGVGKTAIVEGLALAMLGQQGGATGLSDRVLVELEIGRLLSGTQLRGAFAERLSQIKEEVLRAEGKVIVFLDELHTWIGAGASGDGGADAAGELKAALARGRFPCIGATTLDEYKRFIEADPAFRRRFQVVEVGEPTEEVALEILRGVVPAYEAHHKVKYGEEALQAAVQFSQRYIPDQRLPDKAIGLLDLSGSRARRLEKARVDRAVVAAVVSDQTGVPVDKLLMRDRERFLRMEEQLSASLIGHRHVIRRVSQVIRRNYAGFQSGRPIGSFLFLGPTGVGKTELVKVLADFLFRDRNAIVRLDMSEFREVHAVARLIGAPPGYVGYEHGGQLTEAVRRKPYQIILLDEVEKAHPEVLNVLLQLLDDGRLTDGRGRTVDFSNTVVVMTSNLGADAVAESLESLHRSPIGFGLAAAARGSAPAEEAEGPVLAAARAALTPELWNRIEERLVFGPLGRPEVLEIARLQFKDSARRLAAERDIYLEADESLYLLLLEQGGYDPRLGARPMRQTIQRIVEARVSEMILQGEVSPGDHLLIKAEGGQARFEVMDS